MHSTVHMASLRVCLAASANRPQSVSVPLTVTCLHTQALKYPHQRPHPLVCVQMHGHTLPKMHICPIADMCTCSALFCF